MRNRRWRRFQDLCEDYGYCSTPHPSSPPSNYSVNIQKPPEGIAEDVGYLDGEVTDKNDANPISSTHSLDRKLLSTEQDG